jgi:hypothetical protein
MSFLARFLLLCLLPMAGWAQSPLPPCSDVGSKNNCWGRISYPNGAVYTGEFSGGLFNGKGTYDYGGGTFFVGEFEFGMYKRGTLTYSNGSKLVGEWGGACDKLNGRGIEYAPNGSIRGAGIWSCGLLVRSEPVDQSQFPFSSPMAAALSAEETKEQERLAVEIAAERKKRRELEAQLAVLQSRPQAQSSPGAVTIRSAHALVIGNAAYPGSGRLDNPVNDATAMSQKLRSMGFTVTTVTDANRQRLVQAMAQFRRSAASADLSLLFYSGHGVQIFGTNYILPTDVDQTDTAQATIQGVRLNEVIENFMPGKTKIVFLDACRDNPLQRTGDRSVTKGLAPISVAEGTLISYATKDGQVAADGVGSKNSPFTQALLEHLADPQDIGVVLRKVREKVMKATGGKQQPWDYGSLTGGELVLSRVRANKP